jgi:isopenicillin-N N-acyltransferase like protein
MGLEVPWRGFSLPIRGSAELLRIIAYMRLRAGFIYLLAGCLITGCASSQRPPVVSTVVVAPQPRLSIPVGEFRGTPADMGRQQGTQFRQTIIDLDQSFLLNQVPASQRVVARLAAINFEVLMLPEHRTETEALAQAVGVNHYDILLAQCFLDLTASTGCSTIALPPAASSDGVARLGRNLDFPSLGVINKHSALMVYHPADRNQFVAIGWPGMIGVLSGMNEYGLSLACMEVPRQPRLPTAMPYTLLYRAILEQCRTVDEAIDLLQRTPRQTANNLMLMDAAGNRAVVEIRPESVVVRRGISGAALISTNHQRGQDQDTPGYCWRYDRLHDESISQFGKFDAPAIEKMMGHVVQGKEGGMTLQSMVFEPANRVIYLATGSDAPTRTFDRIDLKSYFAAK